MLERLIQFSLKNKSLILILFSAILIVGALIASRMDVDVLPDLTAPTVTVLTESHGYSAEEVEQLVTFPVEMTLNGASHVRRIRSSSMMGISIVWVEFDWDTDIYRARQIVTEKLSTIQSQLPKDISTPVLAPNASVMGEIMLVGLSSKDISQQELRNIADWQIRPRLLAVGGLAHVSVIGGEVKQYQIKVSPEKLGYYGIPLTDVLDAISPMNKNASGGFFNDFGQEYIVRGIGRTESLSMLANILIDSKGDYPVKLSDIAEIEIGHSPKIGAASINGNDSVILVVQKQPDTNTLALTEKIDGVLDDIKTTLANDITIHTQLFRQADFIKVAIKNVTQALLEGGAFVVLILFLFLMNWRVTAISIITIPISLLAAIMTLKSMGLSINTMSLGGMAIAIGSLVDDAIIDVENVFKRVRQNASLPKEEQQSLMTVVFDASSEIRQSIWYSTLIIITAFIPLFFLSGMEGRLLRPLGIAFVVSLLASTVVALSLTPVLCQTLLNRYAPKSEKDPFIIRGLKSLYETLLSTVLRIPKSIIGVSIIAFVGSMVLTTQLGQNFLPPFNEGSLVINVTSMPGISLEESNKIGRHVETVLQKFPEVNSVSRRTGRAELDEHAQGVNAAEFDVPFKLHERAKEEFLNEIRSKLSAIGGISVTIGQPIGHRIDHMLSGTRSNVAIKLFGPNLNQLFQLGKQIETSIKPITGVVDVSLEQQIEIPQIHIKPKHDLLAKYGIRLKDFLEFIDIAFAGEPVGQFIHKNSRSDIILKVEQPDINRMEAIKQTRIQTPKGESIPLYYVADVISTSGPHTINRENGQRKVVVAANISGRDLVSSVEDIRLAVQNNVTVPSDVFIDYGGQFENQKSASHLLLLASIGAIAVIFFLLVQEFKSIPLALIVLVNLPLALIGGIVSVKLTSGIVSIASLIGFITLFGIAVRNGMLLISRYKMVSKTEDSLDQSIIEGSLDRLAPILMTALTTGLALLPLALRADQAGNEIQSPMAIVILGGLLSSTFLNLFVIPVVYKLYKTKEFQMKGSLPTMLVIFGVLFMALSSPISASDFDSITDTIVKNHPMTRLVQEQILADKVQLKTGLTLKNPELSAELFGGASSQTEFVLSQPFDFPTTYGTRKEVSQLGEKERNAYLEYQLYEIRKSVRLSLIEMAYLNKRVQYQEKRVALASKLLQSSELSYRRGQQSVAELNKAKTDLVRKQAQLDIFIQERNTLLQTIKQWGQLQDETILLSLKYPSLDDYHPESAIAINIDSHPKIAYLAQLTEKSQAQVSLQKAENLPDFALGYHHISGPGNGNNTMNGVHVAVTIPIQENAYKVEAKEKLVEVAKIQVSVTKKEVQQELVSSFEQFNRLYKTMKQFEKTIDSINDDTALNKAYSVGQLSGREYFYELAFYYDAVDDLLETEKNCYWAWGNMYFDK